MAKRKPYGKRISLSFPIAMPTWPPMVGSPEYAEFADTAEAATAIAAICTLKTPTQPKTPAEAAFI